MPVTLRLFSRVFVWRTTPAFWSMVVIGLIATACTSITREEVLRFGTIETVPGSGATNGIVIGAPHGTYDRGTGELADYLARTLKIPTVIARGFAPKETGGPRINVNRPTEGAGLKSNEEPRTTRATYVWEEYRRQLEQAAGGSLRVYVELHSNTDAHTAGAIEVATVGVSETEARQIKAAYDEVGNRLYGLNRVRQVVLKIEPVDSIYWTAVGSKSNGSLRLAGKALHIELPSRLPRTAADGDAKLNQAIADFVAASIEILTRQP